MFPIKICGGQIGMRLSEGRVHSGVRVHHVCTENAAVTVSFQMGAAMILEKPD